MSSSLTYPATRASIPDTATVLFVLERETIQSFLGYLDGDAAGQMVQGCLLGYIRGFNNEVVPEENRGPLIDIFRGAAMAFNNHGFARQEWTDEVEAVAAIMLRMTQQLSLQVIPPAEVVAGGRSPQSSVSQPSLGTARMSHPGSSQSHQSSEGTAPPGSVPSSTGATAGTDPSLASDETSYGSI